MLLLLIVNFLIAGVKSKSLCFMFFGVLIFTWFISESVLWVHRGILFFTIFYCLFVSTNYSTHKLKGN
jgi:fatty acid desaturase